MLIKSQVFNTKQINFEQVGIKQTAPVTAKICKPKYGLVRSTSTAGPQLCFSNQNRIKTLDFAEFSKQCKLEYRPRAYAYVCQPETPHDFVFSNTFQNKTRPQTSRPRERSFVPKLDLQPVAVFPHRLADSKELKTDLIKFAQENYKSLPFRPFEPQKVFVAQVAPPKKLRVRRPQTGELFVARTPVQETQLWRRGDFGSAFKLE